MSEHVMNLRQALRRLAKAPGFSAIMVVTLALGIGANTAVFSVVDALLFRSLPYADADRLVELNHYYPSLNGLEAAVSPAAFLMYTERARSFDLTAAQSWAQLNLTGDGEPERVPASLVTRHFFDIFGARPLLGRVPAARDGDDAAAAGEERTVAISYGLWQRRFGADRGVLGRTIVLDDEPYEIVAVMPATFRDFLHPQADLWAPLVFTPQQRAGSLTIEWLAMTARLRPGVTPAAAATEMAVLARQIREELPEQVPADWSIRTTPLTERAHGSIRPMLLLLLGAVGFVLLIACTNVANLLLARGAGRTREIAVRTALGAGRGQIARQFLVESLVVALAGGAAGLALAHWSVEAIAGMLPPQLIGVDAIRVDARVLAFTFAISVLAGLLFGLAPALQALRRDVHDAMRQGTRGATAASGHALRRALVVGELALALTLLTGAGLLIKSFARLQAVEPGFRPESVLTFQLPLPMARYPTAAERTQFFDATQERIAALPGVEHVGATTQLPFTQSLSTRNFLIEGYTPAENEPLPWGEFRTAMPGYVEALGIALRRGRFFDERDRAGGLPVAVVDERFAERYWPGQDPVGRRVAFPPAQGAEPVWREVVGVVAHTKHGALDGEERIQLYVPHRQVSAGAMTFAVRTSGEPLRLVPDVRAAIRVLDPNQPLHDIATLESRLADSLKARRIMMVLLATFAAIALLLAALGIYGVMSQLVTERRREIGVRMAMGAVQGDVLRLVLRQGTVLTAAGVALGIVGALGLTRLIASQLYQIESADPATFAIVALLLATTGFWASVIPARRAAATEPTIVLGEE